MATDWTPDTARPALTDLSLHEDRRPKAPPIPGATDTHRRQGRRLAMIHRMHLRDVARVGQLLSAIEAGEAGAGDLARAVGGLEMTRNYRAFGTLCGQECQVLTYHHMAEDQQIFPHLAARGDAGLRAVIAKLQEEHLVVHALLERLEEEAMELMSDPAPDRFAAARATFRKLEEVVKSHFGYEETELEEALGVHGGL